MQRALETLGHPERRYPCIHIAGSNGKGSTSVMIESIARHAGLRTGLYTSPQLCRFNDRIRVDGHEIDDHAFANALEMALHCKGLEQPLTFFEVLTVAAFAAFAEARVDLAVLEVGLGGRWDATNVIPPPLAAAITSIALEHTAILGGTTAQIAVEKAGILKPGAPCVLGRLDPSAEQAALEQAQRAGAGPVWHIQELNKKSNVLDPRFEHHILYEALPGGRAAFECSDAGFNRIECTLNLKGPHQMQNAALAYGLSCLGSRAFPAMRSASAAGLSKARWPGRFESFEKEGVRLVFDCAHNAHGCSALAATLGAEGFDPGHTFLVFGALADKDWRAMIDSLAPHARLRIYTRPRAKGRNAVPPEELAAHCPGTAIDLPEQALHAALGLARPGDTVLITGSIYLVAELRAAWLQIPCDPIIPL